MLEGKIKEGAAADLEIHAPRAHPTPGTSE